MSAYFIEGPIDNGQNIMLCVFHNITPYYVCYSNLDSYNLQKYNSHMDIAIFRIDNNGNSLYDIRHQQYALIDDNGVLNLNKGNNIINFQGNKYQPWIGNGIFLAGETYQVNARLNDIPFNLTYVIPVNWYQRGSCQISRDFRSSLENNEFSLTNTMLVNGWTTPAECFDNILYNYCNKGTNCSAKCKGPCVNNKECIFVNNSFQCGSLGYWYNSTWFLIILYLILVIVIIYYLIDIYYRQKDAVTDIEYNKMSYPNY